MDRIPVYKGVIVDLGLETVEMPNGKTIELEVIRHPGAAAVVPLHEDGTVTLVWQFRHAGGGMMFEVPAGKLDDNEAPELCARRELREEVGLEADKLELLTVIHTTPGFTDERIYLYLARGLRQVETAHEHDEYIQVKRMPLETAISLIREMEITDAKTICALMLAAPRS